MTAVHSVSVYLDTIQAGDRSGWSGRGRMTVGGEGGGAFERSIADRVSSCAGDVHYIEYPLDEEYDSFVGVIGFQDAAQSTARASVQVLVDDQVVLDQTVDPLHTIHAAFTLAGKHRTRIQAKQTAGSSDGSFNTPNNWLVVGGAALVGRSDRVTTSTTIG